MKYVIILLVLFFATPVFAKQQYNVYTGEWVTVSDKFDYEQKYDPYTGEFSLQPEWAEQVYNPYNGEFEWDSGIDNEPQENSIWEY